MDDNKKTELLAEWYRRLNDKRDWTTPGFNHRFLIRMADDLQAAAMIDPLERFDLVELARAAFFHYTEEGHREWRHPASHYAVYGPDAVLIGSLIHGRYYLHGPGQDPHHAGYFAFLKEDNSIITSTYARYGTLEERFIYTQDGQRLTLVELNRQIEGVMCRRLDDPDRYRALIDAAALALEQGDFDRYLKLWEALDFSIFRTCSQCCDLFALREDCLACTGWGFVEDPQCPSRLPAWLLDRSVRRHPERQAPEACPPPPAGS
jgi:hypothetical protein